MRTPMMILHRTAIAFQILSLCRGSFTVASTASSLSAFAPITKQRGINPSICCQKFHLSRGLLGKSHLNDRLNQRHQWRLGTPSKHWHVGFKDIVRNIRKRNRLQYILCSHETYNHKYNIIPRGGSVDKHKKDEKRNRVPSFRPRSKNIRMYLACLAVVLLWITTGTLFYSKYNNWPIPQSFFYAVDAGMSIGFCTDVAEKTVGSRAFTIIFILLGASCIGGALALFIKDIMEGVVDLRHDTFQQLLAAHACKRIDRRKRGKLTHAQFRLIVEEWTKKPMSDETFTKLCRRFDPSKSGFVESEAFIKRCHEMETLLNTSGPLYSEYFIIRKSAQVWQVMKGALDGSHRIFTVFILWVSAGIWWGHRRQGWDIITATHFAISALATGGLTGPDVNEVGILPTEPAIFCGVFCLFGIPLFALTLGHYARVLVEGYVAAVEERVILESIVQPLDITEFEYAKNLCSTDQDIHLSDYIVLQLLRMGKVDMTLVNLIKTQFDVCDLDGCGRITFENFRNSSTDSDEGKNDAHS